VALGPIAAVTVVVAGPDYPERSDYSGAPISGIAEAEALGAQVFQGGTAMHRDALVTNGGRILSVTATGETVQDARVLAYRAVGEISFEGARFRTDVASTIDR
jgi:phosphoribosylamine--glycine ligase